MKHLALRCSLVLSAVVLNLAEPSHETELSKKAFDPCQSVNYKLLNSTDRFVENTNQHAVKCDRRGLSPGWYRFTGGAGDRLPESCPPTRHCGTHAPGWLNGSHPTQAEGVVTLEVCYHWSGSCCRWKNNIKVKNCGAFYVYELQKPPACSLRYCSEASECKSYKALDQADRAVGNRAQNNVKCDGRAPDNIVSPAWYRMTGASGDKIPDKCVPKNRCGTHAPGWLNGSHPAVLEGVVNRQVCYHWSSSCCNWKNNIKIRNCGSYYVYQLIKPPVCSLRYCGNKEAPGTTSPPPTTAAFDPCQGVNYKLLNSTDRFVENTNQHAVKCDRRGLSPGWYRFTGGAGDRLPESCPPTRHCGTHAPGWLNGSHPTQAEGVVTLEVCYHWSGSCCRWKNNIKVKNCGAFYVYELQKPPACSLRYCSEASECKSYKALDQADRAVGNRAQNNVKCDGRAPDNIVSPAWYRMTGASGDKIPDKCVPKNRCGTHAPGWLNGSHPAVLEGVVNRQVCYHWSSSCCNWKNNIKIRNCGSYYVYQLIKPPVCSLRYCGNKEAPGTTSPPPTTAAFDPCQGVNYKLLNSTDRFVENTNQHAVKCDRRGLSPGWYRFTGGAGDRLPESCPPTRRCGTHAPGWLNGSHPTQAEGVVTLEVCYHWSGSCCRWKNNIKVKNCGAFYVYELQKPPACSLRYCSEASECKSYKALDQADRAVGNRAQNNVKCDGRAPDNIVSPAWYRMTGASGDKIPDKCVPKNRCGTHAPGWLNGSHPAVLEGVVNRQVCYHWSSSCCNWKNNIKIRNCGSYYVYQLIKPPVCSLRYCGNKEAPGTTSPPPTTAAFDPCQGVNYKLLNSTDRFVENTNQHAVKCDRRGLSPGWYRFTGGAGDRLPESCPPTRRCGTHAPGWLNGSHPTQAEGVVTLEVCYHWSGSCCRWKNNIKVKNCGAFYVYELQKPPACSLRYCSEASECKSYKALDQADRAVGNRAQNNVKCDGRAPDNIVSPAWYRMTGASGDKIPDKCVPKNRCGTHAPGWLNGSHPAVLEGVVNRQVCYHWSSSCCNWKNNIKIRNCGSYYVYQLIKPPVCSLRYCGNKEAPGTTSPPPTTAAFDPCQGVNYKLLNSTDRFVENTNQHAVKCDRRGLSPGWYRFTGGAGDRLPESCPPTRRCGTHAPGWLNGSHPTQAEGVVTLEVCYHWSGSCCRWKNNIKVKNCGAFYVYELQKPPACSLRYCSEASECKSYKALDQADRAVGNRAQNNVKCDGRAPDNIVSPAWYRMTGASGDKIPDKCVPKNRCGTHAPGWLNGSHPAVLEGVVNRQVCYHWSSSCCNWKNNIKIRNCGSYYVYQLIKPPVCSLRYCGNKEAPGTTSPPPTTAAFDPCQGVNYKLLNSTDRFVENTNQHAVKCDRRGLSPGWYRFTGGAGDRLPESCPPTRRCGTHAPGWLNGSHPTQAEGVVTLEVCYHWSGSCCRWKNNIKVKNCGAFYVYELQKPPACSLRYCSEASECKSYKALDQADRAVGNRAQNNVKCDGRAPDNIVSPAWYRMTGASGDKIPDKCVPKNRCGTHAPGWLNGSHPAVLEGVVNRQVCYHWSSSCCNWKNNIKIRNCGSYYVYQLIKPPVCSLRYCGNKEAPGTTSPPPTTAAFDPCQGVNYKLLNSTDRFVENTNQHAVKCDRRGLSPGWYRFTGGAGDRLPESCPPTRRCGTHAPGWLNGSHPTQAEGVVTLEVCYHWSGSCCRWKNNIKVKNCGAFYVYELQKPPACSLRYCSEASECKSYKALDQADRAVGNRAQNNVKCDGRAPDNIVSPAWYRMTGASGDKIPDKCVPKNRCGTHAPGWLNGSHPAVLEGVVNRQVCYHWSSSCCNWKNNIKIRNCGSYYVYQLIKPPVCSLRYCGNKEAPGTTSPPPTTAAFDPCQGVNYKSLNSTDRFVENTNQHAVKCDRSGLNPGWYRFTGGAGDRLPESCPPTRRCGTHAPGWLNGSHPTQAEGVVTLEVCYHWSGSCCRWKNNIKVKNCGAFYVYELQKPPACSLRYCSEASECKSYKALDQADRAVGNRAQNNVKCDGRAPDNIVSPAWYRMTGASGDKIPNKCVPKNRCGTHAPGWLNGSHPAVLEGVVNRQVCYHWSSSCCNWKNNIKIRNCGSYYVYQLIKPPVCSLRYCGNKEAPGTTSPPPTTAAFDPCQGVNYKSLNSTDRFVENTNQHAVKCDRRGLSPGWYRFTGGAGDRLPESCPPTRRCGTHAPGWLNGSHPTQAEGVVTLEVCYHWSGSCCRWKNNIKVKNCGAFYVYELQKPPACSLRYCGQASECKSYKALDQADRAVGNRAQNNVKCDGRAPDNIVSPAWYRMTGASGDKIPNKCVPKNRCGTHAPGWLNGSHPAVLEGVVNRQVCYHWSSSCCNWKNNIKIRNCGSYYVYQLIKPPVCSLRYCGNKEKPTVSPTSLPSTTRPPVTTRPTKPPGPPGVNVTCGKNEMSISLPKYLLHGLDKEHLRLNDANCGAQETRTHFILRTKLTECHTVSRHTHSFVCYMNKVLEIPIKENQIITRVREVEIPFSCYYSNMGVVSAVGLQVKSKKILFSKKGFGKFVVEMNIYPDNRYLWRYKKKDFPLMVPLRKILFVQVSVDSEDRRLAILAEECFATPDPDPNKRGLNYTFIRNGCAVDNTVRFISTADKRFQRFSLEAFKFLGEHQFVFLHCRVKICNATDPNSRCAQGCIRERVKRSALSPREPKEEEATLAEGPFMRKDEDEETHSQETDKELRVMEKNIDWSSVATIGLAAVVAVCLLTLSYFIYDKRKRDGNRGYRPLAVPAE